MFYILFERILISTVFTLYSIFCDYILVSCDQQYIKCIHVHFGFSSAVFWIENSERIVWNGMEWENDESEDTVIWNSTIRSTIIMHQLHRLSYYVYSNNWLIVNVVLQMVSGIWYIKYNVEWMPVIAKTYQRGQYAHSTIIQYSKYYTILLWICAVLWVETIG